MKKLFAIIFIAFFCLPVYGAKKNPAFDGMGYVGQYSTGYEIVSDIVLIPRFPMSMVRTGGAALAPAGTDRGDDFVSLK